MTMFPAMLSALSALMCVAGCSGDCTNEGCEPHVKLRLRTQVDDFSGLEVTSDGVTRKCTILSARQVSCDDGLTLTFTDDGSATTSAPADSLNTLIVTGTPSQLLLSFLAKDGSSAKTAKISPEYESVEINGDGCGECSIAIETVMLD